MILQELWLQYLAKTIPTLTVWGVPLVCLQMLGGLRRDGDDYAWAEFIVGFMVLLAIFCFVTSFWPRR